MRRALAWPAWSGAIYPAALLIALVLPFEAIRPVVVTPWFALTDDKLVLLAAVLAWLAAGAAALPSRAEWRALAPSLALLAAAVLAAILAPAYGADALKSTWRLLAAAFVLLLTLRIARDAGNLRALLWALALGAGASGLLGLGEALGWHALDPVLSVFKVAPTRVGGELRVSASFQYATIAAMYFEMVVPLAIVLAATSTRWWPRRLGLAVAAVCAANVVLSLTRAGLLTLAVICAVLLACAALRRTWRRLLMPTLATAAVLFGGVALLALHNPVFDMRLASESDADWYGAAYRAPATLQLTTNAPATVGLDVRNAGRITWTSAGNHPFALGYRWLTGDGTGVLDVAPGEVPLTHDVEPGDTIHLETRVEVPKLPAGTYRLDWGMLQRDVLQFYERGWADAETVVDVSRPSGAAGAPDFAPPSTLPRDDGEAPWVVGRLDLWGAAVRMIQARPVLGVGLDNFRHLYGAELGLDSWDERVQANNLYLELLADLGVLGLAAFAWLTLPVLFGAATTLLRPFDTAPKDGYPTAAPRDGGPLAQLDAPASEPQVYTARLSAGPPAARPPRVWLLGCSLGLVAFLVHGLLDTFLAYTPTAMLFWMLLGISLSLAADARTTQKPHVSGR